MTNNVRRRSFRAGVNYTARIASHRMAKTDAMAAGALRSPTATGAGRGAVLLYSAAQASTEAVPAPLARRRRSIAPSTMHAASLVPPS